MQLGQAKDELGVGRFKPASVVTSHLEFKGESETFAERLGDEYNYRTSVCDVHSLEHTTTRVGLNEQGVSSSVVGVDRGTTVNQCGHDIALARPTVVSENEEIGRQ